jgi:hypothetical protein
MVDSCSHGLCDEGDEMGTERIVSRRIETSWGYRQMGKVAESTSQRRKCHVKPNRSKSAPHDCLASR